MPLVESEQRWTDQMTFLLNCILQIKELNTALEDI